MDSASLIAIPSHHGLSPAEIQRLLSILQREPTPEELGVFAALWSEHCSYKNSILELKKLPRSGGRLLVAAGEQNAGLADIGNGLAIAFKIESHNHPSAVEPYQGAATGVGGIMRDIFCLGARPIASLDSLHFGMLDAPRNRYLLQGVVRGVGDYGNCLGVPTVGGELFFDNGYSANPIVNCMAVGITRQDQMTEAAARGAGNVALLYGSRTGRDGIHGATFASEELSAVSQARRSAVQVGDPFVEKLLMEATLELIREGLLIGVQDLGAAGLACAAAEMAARGAAGIELQLDNVPLRFPDLSAYEILLSESQERMLAIVKPEDLEKAERILDRWEVAHARIGRVTQDGAFRVNFQETTVCEISANSLVLGGGAPVYLREARRPAHLDELNAADLSPYQRERDWNDTLLQLLAAPNVCAKSWVTEQYDSSIETNTLIGPGGDAALLWIKATNQAIALCTDGNPRFCYLNPRRGAALAVAEAARNVSCTGATPIAITNCLNFGNPYKPESFYFFQEAIAGISEACLALDTPVTGGNVSFYNESETSAILPTPVIGMLGLLEEAGFAVNSHFQNLGDAIILLGETGSDLGGSEYLHHFYHLISGNAPALDLDVERRTQELLRALIAQGLIRSAHDCSLGGLAVALAKCCLGNRRQLFGFMGSIKQEALSVAELLFAETPARIILSCAQQNADQIVCWAATRRIPAQIIGEVTQQKFHFGGWVNLDLEPIQRVYTNAFPESLRKTSGR